jgi:hypothetical protein
VTGVATSGGSGFLNDTVTYTATGSVTEGTTADTSMKVSVNDMDSSVVGLYDFWRTESGSKVQEMVSVVSHQVDGLTSLYSHNTGGVRTPIAFHPDMTAFSGVVNQVSFETMNEMLVMGFNGTSNTPKLYNPISEERLQNVGTDVPNFSIIRQHIGRIFSDEKSDPDREHYSETFDPQVWLGIGDSGAIDIGIGDGDPDGITGISPAFKGRQFVGKRNKIYQITGDAPETFFPEAISTGVGIVSHNGIVAVDQDSILYPSDKGFHDVAATDQFGDFAASFISAPIQPTFNNFASGRLKFIQGAYLPSLNSVVWAVSEDGYDENYHLYLYNVLLKQWYRWPEISCQCLATRTEGSKRRLYLGTSDGRILQTQTGTYRDYGNMGIQFRVKTGTIYPDSNPATLKAFKRIGMIYRPKGSYSFTVKVKIDNYATQTITFSQSGEYEALGVDFTLGSSVLGIAPVLAPYFLPIDGYGHGCTIEVEQTGTDQEVEIYGYIIEWEPAGNKQEVIIEGE